MIFCTEVSAQSAVDKDKKKIKQVLEEFKVGFQERDTTKAPTWCDRIFYDNVEIIGTYSIHSGEREWFTGKDKAVVVFKNDWINWGDLDAHVENANIGMDEDLAWISFDAIITKSPKNSRCRTADQSSLNMLKNMAKLSQKNDARSNRLKLMEAAYYANLVLYQYERGEKFVWPIRISGVLQKKDNVWKFRQMHFSHPNRGFPNVRN